MKYNAIWQVMNAKNDIEDKYKTIEHIIDGLLSQVTKEAVEEAIGEIGAKLLAKHSPQAVLDAYFDAANEVIEK